jgi:hypothetical protein
MLTTLGLVGFGGYRRRAVAQHGGLVGFNGCRQRRGTIDSMCV